MKTLILCVDRDDDLGEKGKVTSPVIGRKNNLKAVIALGTEDPEDSDANVIFMGLKLYKKYKEMGREVEIASICGHRNVGIQSDSNLVRQFYGVIEQFPPDTVVLVSDGAEDEVILPLISNRVQIEHIARVVIKQQQNLESTYYIIMEAFKNPKIGKRIILPISLIFMIWGILMIMGFVQIALGMMVTLFAIFLIIKALNVEEQVTSFFDDTGEALRTRRYLLFGGIFMSLLIVLGGIIFAFLKARTEADLKDFLFTFSKHVWPFVITSVLVYTIGNSTDTYFRTGKFAPSTGAILLMMISLGLIIHPLLDIVGYSLKILSKPDWDWTLGFLFTGIILLVVSVLIHLYNRSKVGGKRKVGWLR